jgi:serine/threonine protein kinase
MQPSRLGPFALEAPIDHTETSNVLRGVHVERNLSVAIKLLPKRVSRAALGKSSLAQDIQTLQQLDHPNLVRIYGGAVEQGQPYLVLELVDGESLQQRLARRGRLPWEMAIEIIDGLCEALAYLHGRGIVHQRITPDRILLPAAGGVQLTGLDCKWADQDEVAAGRSPMRIAHYLSPEQFRGRVSATYAPCDLFSLGVVLYECLTGELPWQADTAEQLRALRRKQPAPRVTSKVLDCPVWLDLLSEKLLAKVRSQRLQTAEETHRAIVVAKSKSDAGTGAAQQAWSSQRGLLTAEQDRGEIQRLQRRQRKPRDTSPFYEQAWFLAACLAGVIGTGAWVLWPPSEATLYAQAKPLMESDDPVDWNRAQQQYLTPLLERFPDTQYAESIDAFHERYTMHRAEERIKNLSRFAREPKSEAERAFAEAWEFERFGDRLTAWKKYESLAQLFQTSPDPDERVYVRLAKKHIDRIKFDQVSSTDQVEFLTEALARAQQLAQTGELLEARRTLDSILSLYGSNQELSHLVEQARQQLQRLDADSNR